MEAAFAREAMPIVAAVKFQNGIIEGLTACGASVEILSSLPIRPYPKNRTLVVPTKPFRYGRSGIPGTLMGGINLPVLRLAIRFMATLSNGLDRLTQGALPDVIVVYALHSPHVLATASLARRFDIPLCVFVPDLPLFMNSTDRRFGPRALMKRVDDRVLRRVMARASLAFPITARIAEDWLPASVPFLVVEGVAQTSEPPFAQGTARKRAAGTPTLLYTGSLKHLGRFCRLISETPEIDARFVLIGDGPDRAAFDALSERDSRIVRLPFISGPELERQIEAADFLINPRDSLWPGAAYSFPSKLHDYMSRRKPIISTRLSGIPEEYFDCFLTFSDVDRQSFATTLSEAMATPATELDRRIELGLRMLANDKSPKATGAGILEAISEVIRERRTTRTRSSSASTSGR